VRVTEAIDEPILNGLYPSRKSKWKPVYERAPDGGPIDLENFSFIDNPAGTIRMLQRIAEFESTCTHGRLNFLDPNCPDIGPFLVLQAMNQGMLPIFSGGTMRNSTQRVLEAVGLRGALGLVFRKPVAPYGIWPLPFRSRRPQGSGGKRLLRHQTSELAATDVILAINSWLAAQADAELNAEGESLVASMTGEAMDNAERHSDLVRADGSWSIAGFMAARPQANEMQFRCHLALLSTGASIADSMDTAGDATKGRMAEYVKRHRSPFSSKLTEENLQTVFALQDGVSRFQDVLKEGRGGTGLMDVIEFFAALSGAEANAQELPPRMAIVSGSTCILLRPPYIHGVRDAQKRPADGLRPPRELWFNPVNSPEEPPDPTHVLNMPARLRGTLITMAWTTDQKYLQSAANEADRT
jgi:hypothetical protein